MSRVLTNSTSLRVTRETSVGVLPGTPQWAVVEFDNITSYGATITTVVRRPVSLTRGRRKGTVVSIESGVEYGTDLTLDAFLLFAEGFMFAEFANAEFNLRSGTGTVPPPAVDGGVGNDSFTIDAASALLAGKIQFTTAELATLVYARGYSNSANNGLHVIVADTAGTGTAIAVATATLVAETPPTSATLEVCGIRVLNDADLSLTVTGSTATLVSAASITNWGTLGIRKGMWIHIGSAVNATGALQNALGAGGLVSYGWARVTATPTGATLNLDKLSPTLSTASGPAGGSQDVMFGRFARNVSVTADADDERYLEQSFQFEVTYPDLGGVGVDEYEYAVGNFANEIALDLPLEDKATVTFGFIGTNSDPITASRKTGASTAKSPLRTTAFNTATDIVSITTDVVSAAADICFKSLTLTWLNNVSPEVCLGTLGATFVNAGLFEFNLEGQMLFTNKAIVNAIRNNTTVTMAIILRNDNGAVAIDVPEMTLGGGGREFPVDQSVLVNITGSSFTSNSYGYDASMSFLACVPGVVAG